MEKRKQLIFLEDSKGIVKTKNKNGHLYVLSDDEIKENNTHFYNPHSGQLHISKNHTDYEAINKNGCKKIIATTDTSLGLPQPSQQFITKYIEEYNKGNVITDVLVEYEQDYTNRSCSTCNLGTGGTCELNLEKKCCSSTNNVTKHGDYWISCLDGEEDSEIYKIKVASKDSTITIKKLKDSLNREEILNDIEQAIIQGLDIGQYRDKWIKENL